MKTERTTTFSISWRAVVLIAATYFYFLIFAQFGFLHRVAEVVGADYWNVVLGAMGLSGAVGAIWTAFKFKAGQGRQWLLVSFIGAAGGALFAAIGTHSSILFVSAMVSGFFLAMLTTSLVGVLAVTLPVQGVGLICGIGTGVAYFFSNVPVFFNAPSLVHCLLAVGGCVIGVSVVPSAREAYDGAVVSMSGSGGSPQMPHARLLAWVLIFLVLVWSDSAAFTQIQETPELKAASWSGTWQLWAIACIHLFTAILGGVLMDSRRTKTVYASAFVGLFCGLLGLQAHWLGVLPACVYAAAVSFYSTALVAFALVQRDGVPPVWRAGIVFGISGWFGSGMGIGMLHDLGKVPYAFWGIAALVLCGGFFLLERKTAE